MSLFNTEELRELEDVLRKSTDSNRNRFLNKISDALDNVEDYDLCLWNLCFDCGRQGEVEGVFKATKESVTQIIESEEDVYFGEVLGKHSDIRGTIDAGEITLVSDDPLTVMYAEESGYNPFDYWNGEE